jgi:peptide/nickel transport system permease protein
MARFIVRRLLLSLITLWLVLTFVFVMSNVLPGNVGRQLLGPFAPQETVDRRNAELGTDKPLITQYGRLMKNAATLDFGDSYQYRKPVMSELGKRLGRTWKLVLFTLILTVPISILGGIVAARKRDTIIDRAIVTIGLATSSIPEFVSGVILMSVLTLGLGIGKIRANAPAGSGLLTQLNHLLLPALALAIVYFGYIARMTRAGVSSALDADFARTATMKGMSSTQVMRKHVLRTGLQPTVTVIATQVGYLFGSLVAIEKTFSYPGVGLAVFDAATKKDFPMLQASVLLVAIVYMVTTLLADLVIAWMNPRARLEVER